MPEYWFKYGVTEVSMEIPEEISQKKLETKRGEMNEELWKKIRDFIDDLIKDSGSGRIAILYDHSGDEFSTIILKHVIECFAEEGREEKLTLLTSYWRLDPASGKEHLRKILKEQGIRITSLLANEVEKVPYLGFSAAKELVESSTRILITASEPHGLLGRASLREALIFGGFLETDLSKNPIEKLDEVWERISSQLPLHAITSLNGEVYLGDARQIDEKISEGKFTVPVEDFDVIIVGGGGYPRDYTLQSVIQILGLLENAVIDEGLIAVIAECKGGVGSSLFLKMLLQGNGSGLDWELIKLARRVINNKRVVFTSALPKSILRNLLRARGFDTPQDMLTYALRIYSKEARILILEEPKLKPIRNKALEQSLKQS